MFATIRKDEGGGGSSSSTYVSRGGKNANFAMRLPMSRERMLRRKQRGEKADLFAVLSTAGCFCAPRAAAAIAFSSSSVPEQKIKQNNTESW